MIFLYVLFAVYILSVNGFAFRFVKTQRDCLDSGERPAGDGKLLLTALLGGAIAVYAAMLAMRYRLNSLALMILVPLIAVVNVYCFYLGFSGIHVFLL